MIRSDLEAVLRRAIESGDDTTAQQLAVLLAPYVEAECERMDADPKAIVPSWGCCA